MKELTHSVEHNTIKVNAVVRLNANCTSELSNKKKSEKRTRRSPCKKYEPLSNNLSEQMAEIEAQEAELQARCDGTRQIWASWKHSSSSQRTKTWNKPTTNETDERPSPITPGQSLTTKATSKTIPEHLKPYFTLPRLSDHLLGRSQH